MTKRSRSFASGRVDVLSGSAQLLMPATDRLPPFKMFFFADIFQGYAILAQPDGNYTSFTEFIDQGMSPDEAFQAAVGQMRGKIFAYPPEAAIKGFIDLSLAKGGVTLADMETNVAEDSANVALMQGGRADFQVGGVPSRLTLESAGFKPILTSADLAQYAEASTDSAELRAVFHDGWLATDEWLEANHDTALSMASVGFRINAFINSNPEDAMAIHTPFLNSVAGTDFDNSIAAVAYESLHPFLPFEEQEAWHLDRGESAERRVRHRLRDQALRGAGRLPARPASVVRLQHRPRDLPGARRLSRPSRAASSRSWRRRERAVRRPISWPKRSGTSRSSTTSTPSGSPRRRRRPG